MTTPKLLGHVLNPDELDRALQQTGRVDLAPFGVEVQEAQLRAFVARHPLTQPRAKESLGVAANVLHAGAGFRAGYSVAILADFFRRQWLASGQSFTFETVMSSADKVDLLRDARHAGYRTYLYYVCTDSPLINEQRVAARVLMGGHAVPRGKIASRYERSLALLPEAIRRSSRAFLFDNSAAEHQLVAEFDEGKLLRVADPLPAWFVSSWLNKGPASG